jgi:hypothetical protein
MAKVLVGEIVEIGQARRSYGSIKVDRLVLLGDDGRFTEWKDTAMERSVLDRLWPGAHGSFYHSKSGSDLYGHRLDGERGHFDSSFASPWMMLMAIGMIFGGLATSMFLFPLLVAAAGVAALFACRDARGALKLYRRDALRGPR